MHLEQQLSWLWGILSGEHLSQLTWQPSQAEGGPGAGCRRLAGSHCVVAFRVHVNLDYVFPFGNFKRKEESVPLPHPESKSTSAPRPRPALEQSKTPGRVRGPGLALGKHSESGQPPQNLSFGHSSHLQSTGSFLGCSLPPGWDSTRRA